MRRLLPSLLLALGLAACAYGLPSTEPLGTGPLAEREDEPRERKPSKRPRTAAAASAKVARSEVADAGTPADAAIDATADATIAATDASLSDAGDASPGPTLAVEGEYVGKDVTIRRIKGLPDWTMPDDKARTRVERKGPERIVFVIVNSLNGDPICSLDATTKPVGAKVEATLDRGQSCFEEDTVKSTIRGGKGTFEGDRLVLDFDLDLEIESDVASEGEIDYHFEGTRR